MKLPEDEEMTRGAIAGVLAILTILGGALYLWLLFHSPAW